MKKLKIFVLLIATSLFMTACSQEKPEYDGSTIVVKPAANVQEGTFKFSAITKPSEKTHLEPKEIKADTPIMSPYSQKFTMSKQKVYSELLSTIMSGNDNYVPSEKINSDDLKTMMRIILLDEPRAYALKKRYSYKTDKDGNIDEVGLEYNKILLSEEVSDAYKKIASIAVGRNFDEQDASEKAFHTLVAQNIDNTRELDKLLSNIFTDARGEAYEGHQEEFLNAIQDTVFAPFYHTNASEESFVKAFNAILRENSVEGLAVYGEKTTKLKPEGFLNYDFSGFKETEEKVDDAIRVTMDSTGVNSWNMFKVDNTWFNADIMMSKAINQLTYSKLGYYISPNFGYGMSDEQFAISRLSYYNEDILGVCPMSTETILNSAKGYKDVAYIENSSTARLSDDIARAINNMSVKEDVTFTFSQIDVFNSFVLSKDILFDKFLEQKLIFFENYDIIEIPEVQTVVFYNLK